MPRFLWALFALAALAVQPSRAQDTPSPDAAVRPASSSFISPFPKPLLAPLPDDPMGVTIYRLPNGLSVYLSPNHEEPRVQTYVTTRAGSTSDPSDSTGMAHYLEHMLFKGSPRLGTLRWDKEKPHLDRIVDLYRRRFSSADPKERADLYREIDAENILASRYEIPNEIDRVYRRLGVRGLNAFTDYEETAYVSDIPSNRLDAWAAVEGDRFSHPVFRLFQSELEAVYEEKNRALDNPWRIVERALLKALYPRHPYGRDVLGTTEHLKNPSLAKMYRFFSDYYVPNNMAVILSGDFEPTQALALIRNAFGGLQPKPLPSSPARPPRRIHGEHRVVVNYEAEKMVIIAWPTAPYSSPDTEALNAMDGIMCNGVSGLVDLDLVLSQKVKSAFCEPNFMNEDGFWLLGAAPKRGQSLKDAERLLLAEVEKLKSGAFGNADLKAFAVNEEISEKKKWERNGSRAYEMLETFIAREPWPRRVGRIARYKRLKREEVLEVARHYLGGNRVVVYRREGKPEIPKIEKPHFTPVAIEPSRESEFAAAILKMPAKPLEPRWLLKGRDYTLMDPGAGELIAAKNPFNDLFSLTFHFDFGQRENRRLCEALKLWDLSGAGTLSARAYKKRLYGLGTSLSYGCGPEQASVDIQGLDRHLEASLDLMRKRFSRPLVSTPTLSRMVDVEIGAHQDDKKNPGVVFRALGEFARRGKESPVLNELSDAELKSLSIGELTALLKSLWRYRRRVGYVGDRPAEAVLRLTADSGDEPPPARRPLRLRQAAGPEIFFVQRDMAQSQVGLSIPDEIFDPARAVDYEYYSGYMGGDMSSVIFQEIRESRSLAYAASGGYRPGPLQGDQNYAWGALGCQADKTPEASVLLSRLFRRTPFSRTRFDETKQGLLENYRTGRVFFRDIPRRLMDWEDQGIQGDPRPERYAQARRYSYASLKSFATRFRRGMPTLYILGPRNRAHPELLSGQGLGAVRDTSLGEIFPY